MVQKIKELKSEIERLNKVVENKDKKIAKLETMVNRDFLTGIYNRFGFVEMAEKFLAEIGSPSDKHKSKRRLVIRNLSLIFVDLDDLKKINDAYGHGIGDKCIKISAEIFRHAVREFDIVARWGGDEFVIGLVDANEDEAYKIAGKLSKKLKEVVISEKKGGLKLTASFGVISARSKKRKDDILNLCELIERADMAMYQAKNTKGKNFVTLLS